MESEEGANQEQPGNGDKQPAYETTPSPFFVEGQVVVVGPREDVEAVAQEVADALGVGLNPDPDLNPKSRPDQRTLWGLIRLLLYLIVTLLRPRPKRVEYVRPSGATQSESDSGDHDESAGTTASQSVDEPEEWELPATVLYQIVPLARETPVDVRAVVNEFNERGRGRRVVANPNYMTGRAVSELSGDPDSSEGASLKGANGIPLDADAAEMLFFDQWALEDPAGGHAGIGLFEAANGNGSSSDAPPGEKRSVKAVGQCATVALFDTSPYDKTKTLRNVLLDPTPRIGSDRIIRFLKHNTVPGIPDARDHGVFAASLVQVVAPKSHICLYRVLNDSNRGVLIVLLRELSAFIEERKKRARDRAKPLANTVINLSLGVHVDPDEPTGDVPVPALHEILNGAHKLGAVVVAASGNDSAEEDPVLGPQVPASYDFVIAVGASNSKGQRSCFSNSGDVYAPGGDGCEPKARDCVVGDDLQCVIGFTHYIAPESNYAYWKGTSFSTPLVSGLAALLLCEGHGQSEVKRRIIKTAELEEDVENLVPVINVPKSLSESLA